VNTDDKVAAYLAEIGINYSAVCRGERTEEEWVHDLWEVSLGTYTTQYRTGTGHRRQVMPMPQPPYRKGTIAYEQWAKIAFKPKAPTAAMVLHGLLMDATANDQSFNDWCDDGCYSNDSMKAFKVYQACCDTARQLRKIFNSAQITTLRELLEDY
jgi:hypothetical protein